jgi:hypothetical protein
MVQAVAHHRRRRRCTGNAARTGSDPAGRVRQTPVPRSAAVLHRLRRLGRRQARRRCGRPRRMSRATYPGAGRRAEGRVAPRETAVSGSCGIPRARGRA